MHEFQAVFQFDPDPRNALPDLGFLLELFIDKGSILFGQCSLSVLRVQPLANFCLPFCIGVALSFLIQDISFLICED